MRKLSTLVLAGLTAGLAACGQGEETELPEQDEPTAGEMEQPMEPVEGDASEEAMEDLDDAVGTVEEMRSEAEFMQMVGQARGIFIVPTYGKAGAIAGVRGGEGVLLVNRNGSWTGPAFYDFGGVSLGAQFGAEGGELAMLLMTDRAVESFQQENNFSLNADAGLTIIDWSARGQANVGTGDVIMWSDTEGAFAGVDLSVTDINWDEEENEGYYGREVTPQDVLSGAVTATAPNPLTDALGLGATGSTTGGENPEGYR